MKIYVLPLVMLLAVTATAQEAVRPVSDAVGLTPEALASLQHQSSSSVPLTLAKLGFPLDGEAVSSVTVPSVQNASTNALKTSGSDVPSNNSETAVTKLHGLASKPTYSAVSAL